MSDDARFLLRRADELARSGKYADAVALYQSVAQHYLTFGFSLRAIAISRSVIAIIDKVAPELAEDRRIAIERLADLYTALGMTNHAGDAGVSRRNPDAV